MIVAEGQDRIIKYDGETIEAIIVDIAPGVVKYRKYEQPQGPVFSVALSQVEKVVYEQGKTVVFSRPEQEKIQPGPEDRMVPQKPSPVFGWHIGFGASNLYGDISGNNIQLASAIGVSFSLPLGNNNFLMAEADVLSLGCRFDNMDITLNDGTRLVITEANEDLGYISLFVADHYFLNRDRNFFIEGGLYGSFLISATSSGNAEITDTAGIIISGAFDDDLLYFYKTYDFGLTAGLGGRIPLDKKGKWHLTALARFSYGLTNIADVGLPGFEGYRESNIFGLIFVGVDIPTRPSQ